MNTPVRQRGLSGLSVLVILMLIGFFTTAIIKLLPIYVESWTIKSVLTAVVEDDTIGLSPGEIRSKIGRQFNMNQVTALNPRDVIIKREKGGKISINANYEKRVNFMQNVDLMVKFDKFMFEVQGK
ncbi:MAG: hypothetical protein ACJA0N_000165 [Pseudohongiellaceae bacterium]|jgi:hypothetical protein